MENLIISYYKDGLYNAENLQVFVSAGELSQDTYNQLVGNANPSSSASTAPASSSQPKSSFNPVQ